MGTTVGTLGEVYVYDPHSTLGVSVSEGSGIIYRSDQDRVIDNSCGKQSDKTWNLIIFTLYERFLIEMSYGSPKETYSLQP